MKVLLVLVAVAVAIEALPGRPHIDQQWASFKALHGRVYDDAEDSVRKEIFSKSLEDIEAHNERFAQGFETYEQGLNQFSDLTEEEYLSQSRGLIIPANFNESLVYADLPEVIAPASLDVRAALGPIKNQGSCGSCWAFATTASIEAAYSTHRNERLSLSEQQLVDCVAAANGCRGGIMDTAYQYIRSAGGIERENDYPYQTRDGLACRFNRARPHFDIRGFVNVPPTEAALLNAIASVGPIAVAIDATPNFQRYRSGVFSDPQCSARNLNHAVTLVGYGTENGQAYWLIRNSWGTTWGEGGYGKIARNRQNHCGIASHATYPTV